MTYLLPQKVLWIVHFRFASYLFLHNSDRDVSLLLVVNLLKKKNTTIQIVHHVSLSRNMLQFSFHPPQFAVFCISMSGFAQRT